MAQEENAMSTEATTAAEQARENLTVSEEYASVDEAGFSNQVHFVNLPWRGLTRVARVSRRGCARHGVWNWKRGRPQTLWVNRALAHLARWLMGWKDEDHLSCAVFNLLVALEQECTRPDRNMKLHEDGVHPLPVSDVWEHQDDWITDEMANAN
jgi:hypothetical protein